MNEPCLYEWYDRRQALGLFGHEADAQSLCNGQWVLFLDVVICLARLGSPPQASHFARGSTFCWVADQPYHVSENSFSPAVPAMVIGPAAERLPIHLFVRPNDTDRYLYVGRLGPSYMQQAPGRGGHGMARFDLRTTLPSSVWERLGGLHVGDTDADSVDRMLERLHGPTTVEDRLRVLARLVEYWHGQIEPGDGLLEAELSSFHLPRPLRWWYAWAGRRPDVLTGQNILFKPHDPAHKFWELKTEGDRLLFYLENQGVYSWSTLVSGDDPPVFGRYERSDPWEAEGITLSEHLILACLFEAISCHSPYGAAAACLDRKTLSEIERVITPVAINPWRWLGPTQFYARNGAFMYSMANGTGLYSVSIGAKTELPLQFLKPYLGDSWEYRAL